VTHYLDDGSHLAAPEHAEGIVTIHPFPPGYNIALLSSAIHSHVPHPPERVTRYYETVLRGQVSLPLSTLPESHYIHPADMAETDSAKQQMDAHARALVETLPIAAVVFYSDPKNNTLIPELWSMRNMNVPLSLLLMKARIIQKFEGK
jgi:hypothetical protein